jgi:peptidoglycan/xylan/chitin deacetylase (PgdA/CDA1 family)
VNATFFVVGDWVDKYPESVKALSAAGNEVMNHSSDHAHFAKLSADEIKANVSKCSDKIEAVTGVRPTLFRCPYGEYNDTVVSTVNSMGMQTVQWSVDSLDWKGISAQEITDRVMKNVKPGSIILFHNAAENTPEALPGILEGLIKQGYNVVPISKLLLTGDCTIDSTGCQCPLLTAPVGSAAPQTASPASPSVTGNAAQTGAVVSPAPAASPAPSQICPPAASQAPAPNA